MASTSAEAEEDTASTGTVVAGEAAEAASGEPDVGFGAGLTTTSAAGDAWAYVFRNRAPMLKPKS